MSDVASEATRCRKYSAISQRSALLLLLLLAYLMHKIYARIYRVVWLNILRMSLFYHLDAVHENAIFLIFRPSTDYIDILSNVL